MADQSPYAPLIASQRTFFSTHTTRAVSFRINCLKKLYTAIVDASPEIYKALASDLHKSEMEAFSHEIGICLKEISHVIKHLRTWAAPRRARPPIVLPLSNGRIVDEPYGVVLIIGTWNFPFSLVLMPLIGAIAAGNCAVVKPSEVAGSSEAVIAELLGKCFARHHVAVVRGDATVSEALLKERFDYCFFTGSQAVGKKVLHAAAEYLTPVTLELGGKSPCIIDSRCDLHRSVRRLLWGKFINAGQVCVAPDYLLVANCRIDETIELLKTTIISFFGENPQLSKDFGRIINTAHFNRLHKYLTCGTILHGGDVSEKDLYIGPTLITDCPPESAIMQEEIFGPILPIVPYETIGQAIASINSRPKPLALYLFSSDRRTAKKVIAETSSGGVGINDTVVQIVSGDMPFGGVGASGIGSYHGKYSFKTFSHTRSILDNTTLFDIPRFPPFRPFNLKLMKLFFR